MAFRVEIHVPKMIFPTLTLVIPWFFLEYPYAVDLLLTEIFH